VKYFTNGTTRQEIKSMSDDSAAAGRGNGTPSEDDPRLFSLMEVAQETGIAMPILLRYKREHPKRIPSMGSGSQQRFPEEAFAIFRQIQKEEGGERELPRRGGFGLLSLPRARQAAQTRNGDAVPTGMAPEPATGVSRAAGSERAASAGASAGNPKPRPAAAGEAVLTLGDIVEKVNIPYPTLARYAKQHEDKIPHVGKGRNRRFPPEAIEVFQRIRRESKPGRPPKSRKRRREQPAPAAAPPREPRRPEVRSERPALAEEQQLASRIESL
jgi:hypothetical protein